jgi:RNA polymerase sigma-70 factor (ECF subfamily)
MDEQELISGLERGSEAAFEQLFLRYYAGLVSFAHKLVADDDLARELVQDVFVQFYEKRESIGIHTSLKAHMYQSVRFRCLNYLKRQSLIRGHHQVIFEETKESEAYYHDALEQTELEIKLFSLIQSLPEKCREVFELSRFEGFSNQEIADKLELSKRTVETQISKALKFLRDNIVELQISILIIWLCRLL